jgi:Nucleotidyl transferase AbiEii toxin, Type IV TA system
VADDPLRTRAARAAAERALIRVVHHYGARPEFVVLGGLVPDLLCSHSPFLHSGTTDVDVQVNLEIAAGSVNAVRLERALRNAEFEPDEQRVWRWKADGNEAIAVIKFELLADLDDQRAGSTIVFDGCESLGAANLRGTGFAVRDIEVRQLRARVGGVEQTAEINVSGIAGFLLAKCAAAHSRRKPKDWYDIAYVLLHNDAGGPEAAAAVVLNKFEPGLHGVRTALDDLRDNFGDIEAQGTQAYADEMARNHEHLDRRDLLSEGLSAVQDFHRLLTERES